MAKTATKKKAVKKTSSNKTTKPKTTKVKKSVPRKKAAAKSKTAKKTTAKKTAARKTAAKKKVVKKSAPVKKSTRKVVKKKTLTKKPVTKKTTAKEKKTSVKKKTDTKKKEIKQSARTRSKKKRLAEEAQVISSAESRAAALKKIKGYSTKDLEHFRTIILEKRDEIIEQLQNLREQMLDPTTGEYINENSPYSLHMAEQGTDAMEREKTFLYAQRENKFLGYLEDALKRIDNGIYGICIECIEEPQHLCDTCPLIPKARLEAVPHSQLCLPMKQKQEKK